MQLKPKANRRLDKDRRYRQHRHTPTHFLRLRLPKPRVEIDPSRRWYGVRTMAFLQRRLARKLGEAGFTTWLPSMALAGGQYLPVSGTVMVALEGERAPLWDWHDGEVNAGSRRPFHAIIGPIEAADLQVFADWLTGYGSEGCGEVLFALGDQITVVDGPVASFAGTVEATDDEHCRLKAAVEMLGRKTTVVLPYAQVERVAA
jgi:hypothetical protein